MNFVKSGVLAAMLCIAVGIAAPVFAAITFTENPADNDGTLTSFSVDYTLSSRAGVSGDATGVTFQWYRASKSDFTDSVAVQGATARTYKLPADHIAGTFYYKVKASKTGETPEMSTKATIEIGKRLLKSNRLSFPATTTRTFNAKSQGVDAVTVSSPTSGETYKYRYLYSAVLDGAGEEIGDPSSINDELAKGDSLGGPRERVVDAGTYEVIVTASSARDSVSSVLEDSPGEWDVAPKILVIRQKTLPAGVITKVEGYIKTYDGTEKEPFPTVIDPDTKQTLVLELDYVGNGDVESTDGLYENNIDAGTNAKVKIKGIGNYTGTAEKTFEITKKSITIDTENSTVTPRAYNGTTSLEASAVSLAFKGLENDEELDADDYTLANAKFGSANVATNGVTASATVALKTTAASAARNYTLSGTSFSKSGQFITARAPVWEDFAFDTLKLTTHLYTGTTHGTPGGIAPLTFNAKYAGQPSGSKLEILYSHPATETRPAADTTIVPVEIGRYEAYARISNNANFTGALTVGLGTYVIDDPKKPVFDPDGNLPTSVQARRGKPLVMKVVATSPNSTAATALKYQWFRNDTLLSGATNSSYTYTPAATTPLGSGNRYFVVVTNDPGRDIQLPASDTSATLTVDVQPAAANLETAVVTIDGEYTYTGAEQLPQGVTVTMAGETLSEGTQYTYAVSNNVKAGTALVRVTGVDAFEGTAVGTFTIQKKELEESDVAIVATQVYNGQPQPLVVIASGGRDGLGTYTVTYDGAATAPTNAGTYAVKVKINAGTNFTGSDSAWALGDYTIVPKVTTKEDLDYTPWPDSVLAEDAAGIGKVSMKSGSGYGTVTVRYDGSETVPTEVGLYPVTVEVTGGANYAYTVIPLGDYKIVSFVSTAKTAREIPNKPVVEVAAVKPVKAQAAAFTAGPSPVAKNAGKITFFSPKAVKGGSLYVFDANGNAVAKVPAKQGAGKEVGAWNLKNNKGAAVSEGTYVVKGSLVGKDGTKEKVSFVFSVVE